VFFGAVLAISMLCSMLQATNIEKKFAFYFAVISA
jgi:hypothetical protein